MSSPRQSITLVITGASGSLYGLRLLERLLHAGERVYLLISKAGRVVIATEVGMALPDDEAELEALLTQLYQAHPNQLRVLADHDWFAPIASGSNASRAMVVCPCSCGTLAAIAHGSADSLIERAADVALKERRQLILVVRETPFSTIHLENMLTLSRMGATILPASPGFYHRPERVEELIDFIVARILDHLGIDHQLLKRWGGGEV